MVALPHLRHNRKIYPHRVKAVLRFLDEVRAHQETKKYDFAVTTSDPAEKLESILCDANSVNNNMRCRLYGKRNVWPGPDPEPGYAPPPR